MNSFYDRFRILWYWLSTTRSNCCDLRVMGSVGTSRAAAGLGTYSLPVQLSRGRAAFVALTLVSFAVTTAPVMAGPHEGGTMILHAEPSLVYTDGGAGYCGTAELPSCELGQTTVPADPGVTTVFFAYAAFPAAASPRLSGVVFGIEYDLDRFTLADGGGCGDFEISEAEWPQPGTGTAVSWVGVQTETLVEVYWFAGYGNRGDMPTAFALIAHPTQGGYFVDDSLPEGKLDEIAGFGILGFGTDGLLPCPDGPVPTTGQSWGGLKAQYR